MSGTATSVRRPSIFPAPGVQKRPERPLRSGIIAPSPLTTGQNARPPTRVSLTTAISSLGGVLRDITLLLRRQARCPIASAVVDSNPARAGSPGQ